MSDLSSQSKVIVDEERRQEILARIQENRADLLPVAQRILDPQRLQVHLESNDTITRRLFAEATGGVHNPNISYAYVQASADALPAQSPERVAVLHSLYHVGVAAMPSLRGYLTDNEMN